MTGVAGSGARGIGWLADTARPRLILVDTSAVLRRELGPVAWSAFEVLALSAQLERDGRLTLAMNARELAAVLGVGRDAATRALAVLRDRHLIALEQPRHGGQFAGTRYTVHVRRGEPEVARNRAPRPVSSGLRMTMPTLFDTDAAGHTTAAHPAHRLPNQHDNPADDNTPANDNHHDHDTHPHPSEPTKRLPEQPHALAISQCARR